MVYYNFGDFKEQIQKNYFKFRLKPGLHWGVFLGFLRKIGLSNLCVESNQFCWRVKPLLEPTFP
jgi:hypothetical protein